MSLDEPDSNESTGGRASAAFPHVPFTKGMPAEQAPNRRRVRHCIAARIRLCLTIFWTVALIKQPLRGHSM